MDAIEVEFFGIARQRANQPSFTISIDGTIRLSGVLRKLVEQFPELAPDCIHDGVLSKICSANLNGDHFLSDLESTIHSGDRLLIMSADAGG